ncbi:hypothetical protein [Candidatus Wolbachia massiliensis]|uniref:Uncharacterized protein n=1 Tax=Candidatus Wolbachia massiliensis TaxID=1845000 RepID=A0A7M3U2F4_9RICK|nr:hypothetical protein [Candidatus Wolbachia massiliensis]QOD38589.1 hypothetical protein ID128_01765 [Candidatus Wolbachia massiliensis]
MNTPKKIRKAIIKKFKNWKDSKEVAMEEPRAMLEDAEEVDVEQNNIAGKVAETDTKLCENINMNGKDINILRPISENSKEVENTSIRTTVESTSVDKKTNPDSPSSDEIKPHFDNNAAEGRLSTKTVYQRQIILASIACVVLLTSGVASYVLKIPTIVLKIPTIALVGGIIVLAIISFALYDLLKPSTKIEKVESVERLDVQSALNPT